METKEGLSKSIIQYLEVVKPTKSPQTQRKIKSSMRQSTTSHPQKLNASSTESSAVKFDLEKNQVKIFTPLTPFIGLEEDQVFVPSTKKSWGSAMMDYVEYPFKFKKSRSYEMMNDCSDDAGTNLAVKKAKKKFLTVWQAFAVSFNAVGVVYGDIGTSPIYVLKALINSGFDPILSEIRLQAVENRVYTPEANQRRITEIYGFVSLVIWVLILIPTIKYMIFILKADNDGNGGTFAMLSLLPSEATNPSLKASTRNFIFIFGIIGGAFFLADGVITPAISVLSAMEGVSTYIPYTEPFTLVGAFIILTALFYFQRFGTKKVGVCFAPVMVIWFLTLGGFGIYRISKHPQILNAINPSNIFAYAENCGARGLFRSLGVCILAITGVEAMYADLGHFKRGPIRVSWLFIVFPSLVLQYLGQGAGLIENYANEAQPFYFAVPRTFRLPLLVLATFATVIASQALISGAFSVIHQAIELKMFPNINYKHTSFENRGQVYIPIVNIFLMIGSLLLVFIFKTSDNLANIYGLTVTADMLLTSIFFILILHYTWKLNTLIIVLYISLFLTFDIILFSSACLKIPSGAWLSLLLSFLIFLFMFSYTTIQIHLSKALKTPPLSFIAPTKTPRGIAVFLKNNREDIPSAFQRLKGFGARVVILLTILEDSEAEVRARESVCVDLVEGQEFVYVMVLRVGFMEREKVDLPAVISECIKFEKIVGGVDEDVMYYFSKEVVGGEEESSPFWKMKIGIYNFAAGLVRRRNLYGVPKTNIVEVVSYIDL